MNRAARELFVDLCVLVVQIWVDEMGSEAGGSHLSATGIEGVDVIAQHPHSRISQLIVALPPHSAVKFRAEC